MADTNRSAQLDKTYDPSAVEGPLYDWWESHGLFHAEPEDPGEPFSIVIPPPNVTGSLHIGHALDYSAQDLAVRRARMQGRNTVWLPGTDHAGIATQNVVERELAKEGVTRQELGREAFLQRVWAWREQSGGKILRQQRRLGCSCDWEREAFTFDEQRSKAVREVFCTLFEQGLIYRGYRLINWCPRNLTALSDIEVEHATEPGELARLRYPLWDAAPGPDGRYDDATGLVVATTRAETMLGDTAVAVHPDDDRYRGLVGATLRLPLVDRPIPVIADDAVDPDFGTGAVKVTPAHDPNDYEIGQRHDLPQINVMTDDAHINDNGGPYAGLDRFEARDRVKVDLDALGLLEGVDPREHPVGHCSRCGAVVEPRLSEQWFVKVGPLADRAASAVRDGDTLFAPERNAKGFLTWLENLHDWCISRQIWWGHRIPAWYDAEGNVTVRRDEPSPEEVAASGLRQDPDVLDTWFSSALWPMTTMGWPDDTPELRAWYPTSVLVTGYDINTFWVSRMLMMGLHFREEVPFRVVFNHGLVRDRHGKKMSKSFGNVIDPLQLIERYGADALRFALFREARPGQDVPLAEEWVEGARRFANKLWNAARFVLPQLPDGWAAQELAALELQPEDRWILSRLEAARAAADAGYDGYDPSRPARALYHFVWDEYCDWYLELTKGREDPAVGVVLGQVLDQALRLLHPLMPFLTDAIWRALHGTEQHSVMTAQWPRPAPEQRDAEAEAQLAALIEAVAGLRRFRSDHALAPSARIDVIAVTGAEVRTALAANLDGIRRLARVGDWTFADSAPAQDAVGRVVLAEAELFVPLQGVVDVDEERDRLRRELDRAAAEVRRAEGKLANAGFVSKAPEPVVAKERQKLVDWQETADKLALQLEALGEQGAAPGRT